MAVRRITVSISSEVAQRMREAAGTRPVSTWLADLIVDHLDDRALEEKWLAFYEGVNPKPAEVRKADDILRRATRQPSVEAHGRRGPHARRGSSVGSDARSVATA